ncbi:MAG: ATP-binding protein [Acidobacteriota bacterium]|nr:MAG: ATP-binding protein [Acidobacteriota bacterium]
MNSHNNCSGSVCAPLPRDSTICSPAPSSSDGRRVNSWKKSPAPRRPKKAARNLERRLSAARLGRFKPLADFDWNWPKKIDRDLIEQWLRLEFIADKRNLILIGSNGLGKTLIVKNLAYQAALAGHTVVLPASLGTDLGFELRQPAIAQTQAPRLRPRRFALH